MQNEERVDIRFLMYRHFTVLEFDSNWNVIRVLRPDYLPYGLRSNGNQIPMPFRTWVDQRLIPARRRNIQALLDVIGARFYDDLSHRALSCRLTAINDCFWISQVPLDDAANEKWENISPFNKVWYQPDNFKVIQQGLLTGQTSCNATSHLDSPEFTLQGSHGSANQPDGTVSGCCTFRSMYDEAESEKVECRIAHAIQ